jgi:hypothetical protein
MAGGYLQNPKREEQRVTEDYEAGYGDGEVKSAILRQLGGSSAASSPLRQAGRGRLYVLRPMHPGFLGGKR